MNWTKDFDSWIDFVDFASQTKGGSSQDTYCPGWHGTKDFPEALSLARTGWEEGASRVSQVSALLGHLVAPRAHRQVIGYSVAGPGTVDLQRYQMGHPEPYMVWQDSEDEIRANRGFLNLTFNLSASGGVETEVMIAKGAAACALVDALEREGYRCEIDLYADSRGNSGHQAEVRMRLKNAGDPLEHEAIAMALAHPSTFRRLIFAAWEQAPPEVKKACQFYAGGTYGRPMDTWRSRGDIHIASSRYPDVQWSNPQAAAKWVRQSLLEQGIEVEDL